MENKENTMSKQYTEGQIRDIFWANAETLREGMGLNKSEASILAGWGHDSTYPTYKKKRAFSPALVARLANAFEVYPSALLSPETRRAAIEAKRARLLAELEALDGEVSGE